MATTITLTAASSDLESYLDDWSNANYDSTYGAFSDGGTPTTTPVSNTDYTLWGNGDATNDGVLLESDTAFQYDGGNLTGDPDTLTFGTGYSESSSGISLTTAELTLDLDQSFNYDGSMPDAFDYAIYGMAYNTLNYLYSYLTSTGTVIEDTTGDDTLVSFGGADTFVFSGGEDVIAGTTLTGYGYQDGTDKLDVSAWGVDDVSDLFWDDDIDGNAVIESYDDPSVSITITGVSSSVLGASDFVFA